MNMRREYSGQKIQVIDSDFDDESVESYENVSEDD